MVKLIHSSPLGALEIPGVLGVVVPGETFEAPDEIAESLLAQSDLYHHAPAGGYGRMKLDELQAIATTRGISADGKKADIIAALEAADAEEAQQ